MVNFRNLGRILSGKNIKLARLNLNLYTQLMERLNAESLAKINAGKGSEALKATRRLMATNMREVKRDNLALKLSKEKMKTLSTYGLVGGLGITTLIPLSSQPKKEKYKDSKNKNLQAVLDHSRQLNNNYEYKYLDPIAHLLYYIKNGNIVDSIEVVSGLNTLFDGYNPIPHPADGNSYNRAINTSATPGGVFVFSNNIADKHYKGGHYNVLVEAGTGRKTNVAGHRAPSSRLDYIAKGLRNLSFGCFYPADDSKWEEFRDRNHPGDTIYSAMKNPDNYLYEDNGKIKPYFKETPTTVEGDAGKHFIVNDAKYNLGY